jgi:hypothetical protein
MYAKKGDSKGRQSFILGSGKIFPFSRGAGVKAKVGLEVFVSAEFSGFACS